MKMYENKNAINEDDRTKVNRRASKKPRLKKEPKHTLMDSRLRCVKRLLWTQDIGN